MPLRDLVTRLLGLSRTTKRLMQIALDVLLMLACFYTAMVLRLESTEFASNPAVWMAFLPVIPVTVIAYRQLGLYRSILRFITGQAFRAIGIGVGVSVVTLIVMGELMATPIPRSVPGIFGVLMILSTGGLRFTIRNILRQPVKSNRQPVAIYGAGEAGRQLQHALFHGPEYEPVAYIDDDPSLQNTLIGGRRVFSQSDINWLAREMKIKSVLLALPSISRARRREIVEEIEPLGLEIKTIPGMADIVSGQASFNELRNVTPEDLLGRDPVPPHPDLMGRNITGKVVLVSGAGGSIGSELCRQIILYDPAALVLFDISEYSLYSITTELRETLARNRKTVKLEAILGSVLNEGRVCSVLSAFGVQTIYHAAAYKHVVLVEENVADGIVNNVFGTKILAKAAAAQGVENFIMISTDKAVRPTNFMGASKRMAELVCQTIATEQNRTKFSTVRFGNVLGSSGSVIPRFKAQIENGGPVTVTHREITRFFMTIPEAAQLVIQAGAMSKGGDVFVLDMGDPVKILDLAHSMIRLHGLKPYIIDHTEQVESRNGDIAIQIVGLNKGEKLYEELLIGNDPKGTDHPRIMTATEVSLTTDKLNVFLDRLERACSGYDIAAVRQIFREAPLGYQPTDSKLHDVTWNVTAEDRVEKEPTLRVIKQKV